MAPIALRKPISLLRSITAITITFAIPIPPTSRATAPSPIKRLVNVEFATARASKTSEARLTCTSSGFSGFTVAAITERTSSTYSGYARIYMVSTSPSCEKYSSAAAYPMIAALSKSAANGKGSIIPTTENHSSPIHKSFKSATSCIPRRSAATEPKTTTGYVELTSLRKLPFFMLPRWDSNKFKSEAIIVIPFVIPS